MRRIVDACANAIAVLGAALALGVFCLIAAKVVGFEWSDSEGMRISRAMIASALVVALIAFVGTFFLRPGIDKKKDETR